MRSRLAALGAGGVQARTFHSAALAQLHRYGPDSVGRILPSKALLLRQIANSLPPPYKFRPAGDLATEIEHAKARRVSTRRVPRLARRARAADPGEPDAHRLPRVRAPQGAARRDRLRGPARARDRPARDRRAGAGRPPRPLPRVHGRRVPGRQPAPAVAARSVARAARRPLRRRRRLPVDLRLHGRLAAVAARGRAALSRTRRSCASRRTTALRRRCSSSRTGSCRGSSGAEKVLRATRPDGPEPVLRPFATHGGRERVGRAASSGCSPTAACRSRTPRSSAARTPAWPTSRRCSTRRACRSRARRSSRVTRPGACSG